MNVLDLFSGIGGFSLGLERAGMHTVAFCEIDPYCQRVLRKHWPDVPCYDDVRAITAERLRANGLTIDVIAGGFPCQDISLAGKGAGIAGERSGLWTEYARIIGELRPRYIIVENVAALLVRGMGRVLGDLSALGYDAEWKIISSADVGAPHLRRRVWIVAYRDEPGPSFGAMFRRVSGMAECRSEGQDIAVGGWWPTEPDVGRVAHGVPAFLDGLDLEPCLRALTVYANTNDCCPAETLRMVRKTYGEAEVFEWRDRGSNHVCSPQVLLPCLRRLETECEKEYKSQEGTETTPSAMRILPNDETAPGTSHRSGLHEQRAKQHPDALQELSRFLAQYCQEAWEKDRGTYAADRVSRLRALGNAIVPQIAEIIGRAIVDKP